MDASYMGHRHMLCHPLVQVRTIHALLGTLDRSSPMSKSNVGNESQFINFVNGLCAGSLLQFAIIGLHTAAWKKDQLGTARLRQLGQYHDDTTSRLILSNGVVVDVDWGFQKGQSAHRLWWRVRSN